MHLACEGSIAYERKLHLCDPAEEMEQSQCAACALSAGEKHALHAEPAGLAETDEWPPGVRHAVHAEPDRRAKHAEAECRTHADGARGWPHHGCASGETSALQQCKVSHGHHAKVFALV